MKISVIFTGGTIGSDYSGKAGFISPSASPPDRLHAFFEAAAKRHSFEFYTPVNTLSENMTAQKLNSVIKCAKDAAAHSDALIITHGTDSLAYSSAALGYTLFDLQIPTVIVSSSYILSDPRANGLENLSGALCFIEAGAGAGVFVSYDGIIHRGTRLCPPRAYSDKCESVLGAVYGYIENGAFRRNSVYYELNNAFLPYSELQTGRKILVIPPLPDCSYDCYRLDCDAVLQLSYHSGTVGTENNAFIRFCNGLKERKIPIFLHGSYSGAEYESKAAFESLGLTVLPVMSAAAAYMKLMAADFKNAAKPLGGDII